jgi:hypothetical protein
MIRPNSGNPQGAKSNIILGEMQIVSRGTFGRMAFSKREILELYDFVRMFLIESFVGGFVPRGTIVSNSGEAACMINALIWQR